MDLIVHNQVVPAVNQIETHPFNQQIETQEFLQDNNVQIESWGPFAEGKHNIFQNELLRSYNRPAKSSYHSTRCRIYTACEADTNTRRTDNALLLAAR